MGSLQGQNVVVVGGSRGVGRAIVETVLSEGAVLTPDLGGKATTTEVTEAILKRI